LNLKELNKLECLNVHFPHLEEYFVNVVRDVPKALIMMHGLGLTPLFRSYKSDPTTPPATTSVAERFDLKN
jgi:hypothetical protein